MGSAPISQEIKLPTDSAELGKAILKLDELISKLGKSGEEGKHHGEKQRDAASKLRHEFGQMGHAAEYAKNEIKDLLEFTGILAAIELTEKLVEKVIDIGKEAVKSAAEAERMNRVIDNASGGKVAGKENREWLDEFSKKTEFSEAQGEGAFVDLKKVGTSDQQAKLAIKAAADIAAVSKNKDEAFGATVEAFARLERTGKISNRTLAPLGLGEKDFASLPQFKGMNHKQLSAAIEKGSVSKNDLYALILARTGEKGIGEKAAANADLLGTKLAKLSELPERFYKKLADTKAVGALSKELGDILEKLDPDGPTGKKISGFFEQIFGEATKTLGEIDVPSKIDLMTEAFKGFLDIGGPVLKFAFHELEGIAYLVGRITGHLKSASDTNKDNLAEVHLKSEVESYRALQKYGGGTAEGDAGHRQRLAEIRGEFSSTAAFEDAAAPLRATAKALETEAAAIPDGVTAGIKKGKHKVAAAAAEMGDSGHEAFMGPDGIDANSPSRKFHYGGQMAAEGVALGFESKSDRIADAMTSTMGPRLTTGGGGRVATGGRSIHLTVAEGAVQMAVHGSAGSDVAGQVREELARSFVPMLVDALESAEDGR